MQKAISIQIFYFTDASFSLKFIGIVFVSSSYDSITSSHISAELFIIIAKYFPFHNYMQQDCKDTLFYMHDVSYTHININIILPLILHFLPANSH